MQEISALLPGEMAIIVATGVILLVVLFLARIMFKLTATLFRMGCALVFFIVAAVAALLYVA